MCKKFAHSLANERKPLFIVFWSRVYKVINLLGYEICFKLIVQQNHHSTTISSSKHMDCLGIIFSKV